ncbi:MAG: hypothetical protein AUI83_21205 [Armatimonadetes bacterium 13_1_40CM_3_65_7]|nr:MAG: hypothetical protein AUI83_21205 [Armatimonadetes bacterium 13_1_40CM_3_65_7]
MADPTLAPNAAFALVLLVVAFASAVKGALGFGFPLIAVPLSATLIGSRTAVVLIAVSVVFSNFLVLFRGGGTAGEFRRFAGLLAGVIVGTVIGAQLLSRLDPGVLSLLVGVTALLLAGLGLLNKTPHLSIHAERIAGPTVGLAAGVMGGTTGIFAPLLAGYLQSLQVGKRAFVFWLTALFFAGAVVQVLSYSRLGLYSQVPVAYALVTFVPAAVGTLAGFRVQDRLPVPLFRRLVLLLLLAVSLRLIWSAASR